MKATAVVAAILSLIPVVALAQPVTSSVNGGLPDGRSITSALLLSVSQRGWSAVRFGVGGGATPSPAYSASADAVTTETAQSRWTIQLSAKALERVTGTASSSSLTGEVFFRQLRIDTAAGRKSNVDWNGLFGEQIQMDKIMHAYRMTESKTVAEMQHEPYFERYISAVRGYFTTGMRWEDGDPFFNNNVNHPLMGAASAHIYLNHDRRCKGVGYGDHRYWGCMGRATVYSVLASVNWEWNPLMSESAIGHVGRSHTCLSGKCVGEGGWSDFVMTPLGGIGLSIAGDIARAKLWPKLDRHLSDNLAARILKVALKVATNPASFANAAFSMNFKNVMASRSSISGR